MVKPRENRVPIMLSDAELKAIDDWRYANRVATRSDAIRRLAQVAIKYCLCIDSLDKSVINLINDYKHLQNRFDSDYTNKKEIDFSYAFNLLLDDSNQIIDEVVKLFSATRSLIPSEYDEGEEKELRQAIWETDLAVELRKFLLNTEGQEKK